MKKMVLCIIGLLMVMIGCASSGRAVTTPPSKVEAKAASSPGMDLDAAIKEAAAQMGENLPAKTEIALVSVASSSAQLSEYVISRLEAALVSGKKLVVVDRANLDKVRAEQGFQLSGEVDDSSAKAIGKLVGAGAIVTGSFTNLGDVYSLTLKAINIETAAVAVSYPADIAQSTRIETMLASGGGGVGTQTAQRANAGGNTGGSGGVATPPAPAYKIGDTGPAGGLVFYDKGNNTGGWRYLEAAPADTEFTVQWRHNNGPLGSGMPTAVGKTFKEIGTGQINTQNIMRYFSQNGGGFGLAAQVCDELAVNGFNDWFLPSQDELGYIYGNLCRRGLGGFSNEWYYSSTTRSSDFYPVRINFENGEPNYGDSAVSRRVRAIRQF